MSVGGRIEPEDAGEDQPSDGQLDEAVIQEEPDSSDGSSGSEYDIDFDDEDEDAYLVSDQHTIVMLCSRVLPAGAGDRVPPLLQALRPAHVRSRPVRHTGSGWPHSTVLDRFCDRPRHRGRGCASNRLLSVPHPEDGVPQMQPAGRLHRRSSWPRAPESTGEAGRAGLSRGGSVRGVSRG